MHRLLLTALLPVAVVTLSACGGGGGRTGSGDGGGSVATTEARDRGRPDTRRGRRSVACAVERHGAHRGGGPQAGGQGVPEPPRACPSRRPRQRRARRGSRGDRGRHREPRSQQRPARGREHRRPVGSRSATSRASRPLHTHDNDRVSLHTELSPRTSTTRSVSSPPNGAWRSTRTASVRYRRDATSIAIYIDGELYEGAPDEIPLPTARRSQS